MASHYNGNGKRIDAYYHDRIYVAAKTCTRIHSVLSRRDTFPPNRARACFFPIFAVAIREALDPFSECDTMKLD